MSKIRLIFDTVKYLKPRQFFYRGWYFIRGKIKKSPYKSGYAFSEIKRFNDFYKNAVGNDESVRIAEDILNNIFPFYAGDRIEFEDGDWNLSGNSYRLKCFKLNSFDWLVELKCAYEATGDDKYIKKGFELINNWIDTSTSGIMGDRWNPYVTANRIKNWIGFLSLFASKDNMEKYAKHISIGVKELKRSIEYQLGANHLLSEAKALMFGGYFLKRQEIYDYGKKLLKKEYTEQFLSDGGHYERSISYHVEALQQYFEAAYLMNICGDKDFAYFSDMIKKSYLFLHHMIEVNGKIPLFNDAADDYTYDATDFLSTSALLYNKISPRAKCGKYYDMWKFNNTDLTDIEWDEVDSYSTGIYKDLFLNGEIWYDIMMDVGDNGPDYNLGHAHADALSILFTGEKGRIFADSGVYTYKNCKERTLCRQTGAHNTIEIDGQSSAQVWGAFRTAKRGHTKVVKSVRNEELVFVRAVSDGYRYTLKSPVLHTREYTRKKYDNTITIRDILNSASHHKGVLKFNLGIDCSVKMLDEYKLVINEDIFVECSEKISIKESRIAECFGKCSEALSIVAEFEFDGDKDIVTNIHFRRN